MNIEELSHELFVAWNTQQVLQTKVAQYSIDSLSALPYNIMYPIYKFGLKQKQAEKFIENWVAVQLGIHKKPRSSNGDLDLGDLIIGDTIIPGKNNIELKVSFESSCIGGGQFRFYEPIAGYLFMKAWNSNNVEFFYLSKDELLNEIRIRATTPYKTDANNEPVYYTAFCSSQGSGKITGNNSTRLQILKENESQNRQDLIGWNFNVKTEPELYKKWQTNFKYSITELKEKLHEL